MAWWTNKTGLAKAAAILAAVLGVSLGLCGINAFVESGTRGGLDALLFVTGFLELGAIAASLIGLFLVGLFAVMSLLAKLIFPREKMDEEE